MGRHRTDRLVLPDRRRPEDTSMIPLLDSLARFGDATGFAALTWGAVVMIAVACLLMYLAIVKRYEPLLLLPIGFGVLLANIPLSGLMEALIAERGLVAFDATGYPWVDLDTVDDLESAVEVAYWV